MSSSKVFANFIIINISTLVQIYAQLLEEAGGGYEVFPHRTRLVSARRLVNAVVVACETESPDPLVLFFEQDKKKSLPRWPNHLKPPQPLVELDCLEQTLLPVVTDPESRKFLSELLTQTRATALQEIASVQEPPSPDCPGSDEVPATEPAIQVWSDPEQLEKQTKTTIDYSDGTRAKSEQSREHNGRWQALELMPDEFWVQAQQPANQTCPHLGLAEDRDSHCSIPDKGHICFASRREQTIPLDYQNSFCFSEQHLHCAAYVEAPASTSSVESGISVSAPEAAAPSTVETDVLRTILWGLMGLTVGVLIIAAFVIYSNFTGQEHREPTLASQVVLKNVSTVIPAQNTSTPTAQTSILAPTATPVPAPDSRIYNLSPAAGDIGWVVSGEDQGNHFGDSFLYAGIFEGQIYSSAFQFDLSSIPRGAPIHQATLRLTGLRDDRLHADGTWMLQMLDPEPNLNWRRQNYQDIFNAAVLYTMSPVLSQADLAAGKPNTFELTPSQIRFLTEKIIDDEKPAVSFRLQGPLTGADNLFAWDSGFGPKSESDKVTLTLNIGTPPETPPPYDFILVTSTPTPENVATAAAIVLRITADAAEFGTATPPPPNIVTATPIPDYLIIVPTETPENAATAQAAALFATASALVYGTPTLPPANAVTATPALAGTPTPTYVIITSTPTPESLFGVATSIAQVQQRGMATPLPANWVTPIVVTATPTPANGATVQARSIMATAQALTTGTPTPTPGNVQTATPTPEFILIEPLLSPTPTSIPSATPEALPAVLLGKILFLSDREGLTEGGDPGGYVLDPNSGQLGRLTAIWPYQVAVARDRWSADQRFRAFTRDIVRYRNTSPEQAPAIFWYDHLYDAEEQVTNFGHGIAYGGVWSPTSEQIAFVSNESGDDEIWVANRDGSIIRQLTTSNTEYNAREIGKDTFLPEINKHPSWSPDGSQVVFFSNRTGNNQLWIMNADGSNQRLVMDWTPYNDWNPVWVKYLDPPPFLEE